MSIIDWAAYIKKLANPKELITVEVTYLEGSFWHRCTIPKESVAWAIARDRQDTRIQNDPIYSKLISPMGYFCNWSAMRFPSGAIYDFVLARSKDPCIRKLAWR